MSISTMAPAVSIIVPIYNVEKYLPRCMDSLLSQTLRDIEIILVDDGSPDNCGIMCDQYAFGDSRIKVVHKNNEGLGLARNSGMEVAIGEYTAFIDSDDYIDKNMMLKLYREAQCSNADVVYCNFLSECQKGKWKPINEVYTKTIWEGACVKTFMLDMVASEPYVKVDRLHQMSVWHGIYRSEIIKSNGIKFQTERKFLSEDILFQVDFLKKTRSYCSFQTISIIIV